MGLTSILGSWSPFFYIALDMPLFPDYRFPFHFSIVAHHQEIKPGKNWNQKPHQPVVTRNSVMKKAKKTGKNHGQHREPKVGASGSFIP